MRSVILLVTFFITVSRLEAQALPGTQPLSEKADFARAMLDGLDKWLDRETAAAVSGRDKTFKADFASADSYNRLLEPKRDRLRKSLGLVDTRVSSVVFEKKLLADTRLFTVYAVRWPAFANVTGEGLLLEPKAKPSANIVAIPDADQTPEQIAGIAPGANRQSRFARLLAENGCRTLVVTLVDRKDTFSGNAILGRLTNQSHREFIQRMAWEMGRTIPGYELQRILAGFDALAAGDPALPRGIYGFGEGGRLALYAAALEPRIESAVVSGDLGPDETLWREPLDRDVWNVLREFDTTELIRMTSPRSLILATADFRPPPLPAVQPGRGGAAPGTWRSPSAAHVVRAIGMAEDKFSGPKNWKTAEGHGQATLDFLVSLKTINRPDAKLVESTDDLSVATTDSAARQKRQFDELVAHTQGLMPEAVRKRQEHVWNKLDVKSLEAFQKSQTPVREAFLNDVIGKMPEPVKDMKPRTRLVLETPKWKGYEVVLDVFDEVIAYGILLVPNDIKPGERRPCVVCQHGLEGRPMDVVDPTKKTRHYNSFGAQLADRGYVVFAPQAPYIFKNDFRQIVRKMHPLGYNLYAVILRQHQQILNFLATLEFVDASRIAYYGLSYGGKVAMRIPAILLGYCAVICSGDFNEWIWKNITLDWGGSYMFTGEYEMFEFDLGNRFNYAEMAALIAPRPFMVERGHDDGVGLDEYVAFEFAKVRRLYSRLKISERTEIEFFPGGHEIHGVGTFAFLDRHLNWKRD